MKLQDALSAPTGHVYRPERCEKITDMFEYAKFIHYFHSLALY